jgi:hypothetical protein
MSELSPLDPWEKELEQSLRSLTPAAGEMALREVWYGAGLLAARRRVKFWRGVAAAIVVLASIAMFMRPRPQPVTVERYVYVPRPSAELAAVETAPASPPSSYLALRNAVESGGWRALETAANQDAPVGATGQIPVRPIDEATPGFWAVTNDRG